MTRGVGSTVASICAAVLALAGCTSSGDTVEEHLSSATTHRTNLPTPPGSSSVHSSRPVSASRPAHSSSPVHSSSSAAPSTSAAPSSAATGVPLSAARRALAGMSEAQRVGQLIMVDCPSSGLAGATVTAIGQYHVGSVILDGNSLLGVEQTHALTAQLQALAPRGVGLFISTDQEGGLVQRMRGPGFSSIPSAVEQGREPPSVLRASANVWGRQLHVAGINVDLAPVLDTVPADSTGNPPIGDLDREYGHAVRAVTRHGVAVARGLADAGIDATVKHFPGLGRVGENTDTTPGVTDPITTRHDAYLAPFAAAIVQRVPFVMMSTAIYSRIHPNRPAAFSWRIVTGMLRHDLGFTGVIISDDIGSAAQVSGYSPGRRAVRFVHAGGDIVLTVDPGAVAPMTSALLARAGRDPAFSKQIDAAALVVLRAKQARGLLG